VKHFWQRWLRGWLPRLYLRKKWLNPQKYLQVGEVVLIVLPDTPRGQWPLGRVIEVHPGEDGRVRAAKIQVERNVVTPSVSILCFLEVCD